MKSRDLARAFLRHALLREPLQVEAGEYVLAFHDQLPARDQAEHEVAYDGYQRIVIPATAEMWEVADTDDSADADLSLAMACGTNRLAITGEYCTGGADRVITHWSLGRARAGASPIRFRGALSEPYTVTPNHRPEFPPGALIIEEH